MSWTDKKSIEHIKKIRDLFKVNTFIETGTFKGMNVIEHLKNFKYVISVEKDKKLYEYARSKINSFWIKEKERGTPILINTDSEFFLKRTIELYKNPDSLLGNANKDKYVIFYLDAHFYDKNRPKGKGKFVVLDELKQLKNFDKAIIIIHDFDNNLGHITYDDIPLNLELLKDSLLKVNPNFKFYTNELKSCDIKKIEEARDEDEKENLEYAWSKPDKTYRGILYCVPKKINIEGLREIK